VLKDSATFEALRAAWEGGAVVAGSAAGAMVLTDPMVDPRGGALTLGLGLLDRLAVVPNFGDPGEDAHGQKLERTLALAPAGLPVVGIPERTALLRHSDGGWSYEGGRAPVVFVDGAAVEGLGALG
jgi:cyanophycinase